jgi:glycosyltransferase involved in cell wall biosynthesis
VHLLLQVWLRRNLLMMPMQDLALDGAHGSLGNVSVVVPTCNRRDQILRCVGTLLEQTKPPREVIVVDDGSTDGTAEALGALSARAGSVMLRVIRNDRTLGANASRNVGIQSASCALVAFLDSDCVADPRWIECLCAPFKDPSIGAASGLVEDTQRSNCWERAFAGTHRLPHRGPVRRFTSCNLMVRRHLLTAHRWEEDFSDATREGQRPDTSFSGRCDEEGLFLAIKAAGWVIVAEPSARLEHAHPYTWRSFRRQAWHGGRAAAELVWKFRLHDRLDVAPFLLAAFVLLVTTTLAASVDQPWAWMLPILAIPPFAAGCAAVAWNETTNKGKSLGELIAAIPALFVYYALRSAGYALRRFELCIGVNSIARIEPGSLGRSMPRSGMVS